jgi:hypothetical protein
MNDQTTQLLSQKLDQLAAKLGVAATHLWAALVRQQYIEGVLSIVYAVAAVAGIVGLAFLVRYLNTLRKADTASFDEFGYWLGMGLCVAVSGGLGATALGYIGTAITALANPEYGAFQALAGMLH